MLYSQRLYVHIEPGQLSLLENTFIFGLKPFWRAVIIWKFFNLFPSTCRSLQCVHTIRSMQHMPRQISVHMSTLHDLFFLFSFDSSWRMTWDLGLHTWRHLNTEWQNSALIIQKMGSIHGLQWLLSCIYFCLGEFYICKAITKKTLNTSTP